MRISFTCSGTDEASKEHRRLTKTYGQVEHFADAEVVVAIGGDGHMLRVLRAMDEKKVKIPVFGLNMGTVGYAMNDIRKGCLVERIQEAVPQEIRPLHISYINEHGHPRNAIAWNEGTAFRLDTQALKLEVSVNDVVRIKDIACDGLICATPFGSTAYNQSAGGPILPLESKSIALTSVCPIRPRHWPGAVLPHTAVVAIKNLDPERRPMVITADSEKIENVREVYFNMASRKKATLLFDKDHGLEERILREQFPF